MRVWLPTLWLMVVTAATVVPAAAQDKKPPAKAPPQAAPQTAPAPAAPAMPDAFKLNLLIRSSIIALNQANQTGNYTVLQDLAAPAFRAANTSAKLAQIFSTLRQRQLDLSPVLFFTPKLIAEPQIAPNGLLRLVGFFPTEPERVNFELIFQLTDGQWRLFGIAVNTSPAEVTSAIPPGGAAPQTPGSPAPPQNAQGQPATPPSAAARPEPAPKAAQKPDSAQRPSRKQATQQNNSGKPAGAPAAPAAATAQTDPPSNGSRINLDAATSPGQAQLNAAPDATPAAQKKPDSLWENITPFNEN